MPVLASGPGAQQRAAGALPADGGREPLRGAQGGRVQVVQRRPPGRPDPEAQLAGVRGLFGPDSVCIAHQGLVCGTAMLKSGCSTRAMPALALQQQGCQEPIEPVAGPAPSRCRRVSLLMRWRCLRADCELHDARQLLPPAAAADPPPVPEAARGHVAQEPAAPPAGQVRAVGV